MRYTIALVAALVCSTAFAGDRGGRFRPFTATYSPPAACSSCQQGSCSLKAEQPTVIQAAATVAAPVATCSGGSCQAAPARRGLFGRK